MRSIDQYDDVMIVVEEDERSLTKNNEEGIAHFNQLSSIIIQ